MESKFLRTKETARLLNISTSTLFDWTNPKSPRFKADFPKSRKIGRSTFYAVDELNAYMKAN